MSLMNWMVCKAMGLKTIGQNCHDGVVVFLTQNGILDANFEHYTCGRSFTDARFKTRVYAGTGNRAENRIGFLLCVDENAVCPWGAIVDPSGIENVATLHKEFMRSRAMGGGIVSGSFFTFASNRLGTIEELEQIH